MKGSGSKKGPEVMKKLIMLGDKQGSISLKDLSLELGLSQDEAATFIRQLFPAEMGARIYTKDEICMVEIDANALHYMLPLTPAEWIELNQLLGQQKNPILNLLKKKMSENGPIKAVMELLNQLDQWDHEITNEQQTIITLLDKAAETKGLIALTTNVGKKYQVFPCKVIHLEGKLSMIAEDANDHCLMVMSLSELTSATPLETTSVPEVSAFEIEEFIVALRSMSEKETRLILKIHDPQSVNLFPSHHFLGKPCMVTNPNGDLIWAAYVEPGADLYEWLLTLGGNVEVLDPGKFKDEFLAYCEEKLRKVA